MRILISSNFPLICPPHVPPSKVSWRRLSRHCPVYFRVFLRGKLRVMSLFPAKGPKVRPFVRATFFPASIMFLLRCYVSYFSGCRVTRCLLLWLRCYFFYVLSSIFLVISVPSCWHLGTFPFPVSFTRVTDAHAVVEMFYPGGAPAYSLSCCKGSRGTSLCYRYNRWKHLYPLKKAMIKRTFDRPLMLEKSLKMFERF